MYNTLRLIFQSFFCTINIGGSVKNKFIKILLIIVLLFSLSFLSFKHIENIKADSGWDTDYDSSWDSGSDWGGSSWDNDYDYDYDDDWDSSYSSGGGYSGSVDNPEIVFIPLIVIVIIVFTLALISPSKNNNNAREKRRREYLSRKTEHYNFSKLTLEQANKVIPNFDIEEFNFKAYQIFYDTQMAWMNFDYDRLKDLVTDELYNSYVMDLDVLKVKNQKNTMKGFELLDSYIFDLKEVNGKYIAKVYLNVSFYDYIENSKTGIVLRGTTSRKLNNTYILTFIRTKGENENIKICPSCGAPVEGNVSGVCEYCRSKLINETHDWVMSKKEKISQR